MKDIFNNIFLVYVSVFNIVLQTESKFVKTKRRPETVPLNRLGAPKRILLT